MAIFTFAKPLITNRLWDHEIPNFLWKVSSNSMVPVTTNQQPELGFFQKWVRHQFYGQINALNIYKWPFFHGTLL